MKIILLFFVSIISYQSFSQGATCATAAPFCTSTGATFPASTNTTAEFGPNYGCLGSEPNPAWYYLQISQAGNLNITLSNSANVDVDFIAWGPYNSIASMCPPTGSSVDCSYSSQSTEYLNLVNTQVGQYYLVLITNYSGVATSISAQQTSGTGATNCNIVNPCSMTAITNTASACVGGTFGITGQVQFTNPPTTGTLTVTSCSGNQQVFNAPFTSPINYSLAGITADATPGCSVTAVFSADPACTITSLTFTEPFCSCFMNFFNPTISACDGFLNTYGVTGDVGFINPPSTGSLIIEVNNGSTIYSSSYPLPVTSPFNWDVLGIPADGASISITAYFSTDPACTIGLNAVAPQPCFCSALPGTFNGSITGVSTNNYVLCFGDQINLSSNLDYTPPGNENVVGITYDPGIAYLVYTCPPTVFPTNPLWDPITGLANDPCLLGVASFGDNFSDINSLGGPSFAGTFTNNTVYYVPITTYSNVDNYYAISINGGPWCFNMGTPFAVQYLPEIIATSTQDCFTSAATFTVSGGLPAIDGSSFVASNLAPITATFGNTTTLNGGTIVINGLQDGDMYSFDIIDANGCPQTFSGGPFVGLPIANAGPDGTSCTFSYTLGATPSIGAGTWTGTGVTFSNVNSPTATVSVTAPGAYTITWTEDNGGGCIGTDNVVVQFSNLSYVEAVVQSTCLAANGSITLTASNGIAAYQFSIDNGITMQGTGVFTGLLANSYNVLIQDNIGCQITGVSTVLDQGVPFINSVTSVDVICNGSCDGAISINATGATQFSIDNGVTFQPLNAFSNLCIGTYPIVVTNAIGCQVFSIIDVVEPPVVTYSTVNTDLVCFEQCTGIIDVIATGGVGALQYSSDNGTTFSLNSTFSNLCAGSYNVLIQDANGCQASSTETLVQNLPISIISTLTHPICSNSCDGTVNVIPSGGDGTYLFTWSNGTTIPFASSLCSGVYNLNITDGNGCTFNTSFTLLGPVSAVINNVIQIDESCIGMCDGSIEIDASNVTQYSIDNVNFTTNPIFTNLCAGSFTAYAQDVNNCLVSVPAMVSSPPLLIASATSVSPICINGSSLLSGTANGGTAPYSYSWADNVGTIFTTQNGNVSPVVDASYMLTITDANGCVTSNSIFVQVHDSLNLIALSNQSICNGFSANLSAIAGGGDNGPYIYSWDQGLGLGQSQTVSPTITTVYTVTVNDGCETPPVSQSITITVNTVPNFSFTGVGINECAPVTPIFTSNLVPAGSTCLWNFGNGTASQDCDVTTNVYSTPGCWDVSLTITTAEGCTDIFEIPNYVCVYDYPIADFTFGPQPTTVLNTEIFFNNQSTNAVDYNWVFDTSGTADSSQVVDPSYIFPNSQPGTYEVCLTAITNQACEDTICKNVIIDEEFLIYVPNAFTPDGDLINDIFLPVVKGIDPMQYELLIFNRWGELIFDGSFPTQGWDGYYKGIVSQTDVYVWKLTVVDASSNEKHKYVGHVTLLK